MKVKKKIYNSDEDEDEMKMNMVLHGAPKKTSALKNKYALCVMFEFD